MLGLFSAGRDGKNIIGSNPHCPAHGIFTNNSGDFTSQSMARLFAEPYTRYADMMGAQCV